MTRRRHQHGFTLLEVMVALAVLAVALAAVLGSIAAAAGTLSALRERSYAGWVAENQASQFQLANEFPDPGTRSGEASMGGQSWRWELRISATDDPDLRRADIAVRPAGGDGDPVLRLVSFKGRPR